MGAIEHIAGGHRTTQALAEALARDGSIVTIDHNPLSLELSRYYCRGLPTPVTTLCGDVEQLLRDPPAPLKKHRFDLVLIHHLSDNDPDATPMWPRLREQMRPLLSPDAWFLFQSLYDRQPSSGSLQSHLLESDYGLNVMPIEDAKPRRPLWRRLLSRARDRLLSRPAIRVGPPRFLIVARPRW